MIAWVPSVFTATFGILALLLCVNEIVRARTTSQWPTTLATIVSASVVRKTAPANNFASVPQVSFRYQVGPHTFTSDRYAAFQTGFFTSRGAEHVVARYRPGTQVTVSYSPSDPGNAVLATGLRPVASAVVRALFAPLFCFAMAGYLTP